MTGSLRIKNKKYYLVFSWKDDSDKQHQKSEATSIPERGGKKLARELLNARLAELQSQSMTSLMAEDMLFIPFLKEWLEERAAPGLRPNTLTQYRRVITSSVGPYKPFAGVKLRKLTPALIQHYVNERVKNGLSPNSIRKEFCMIRKCLEYVNRLDLIPYNPATKVDLPKKKKYTGAKAFTPIQLNEVLEIFKDDPLEVAVQLAVFFGMRRSEVCGLRWEAINFELGTLEVCHTAVKNKGDIIFSDNTKTATSRRTLPLMASIRSYLRQVQRKQAEYKELFDSEYIDSGYVCTKKDGAPIDPDFVTHHFQRVMKAHGISCRFHDLRHSAVNTLRKGGCDAKDIQSFLGHSDVSTTLNIYGHLMERDMSRMGAVMDRILSQNREMA